MKMYAAAELTDVPPSSRAQGLSGQISRDFTDVRQLGADPCAAPLHRAKLRTSAKQLQAVLDAAVMSPIAPKALFGNQAVKRTHESTEETPAPKDDK